MITKKDLIEIEVLRSGIIPEKLFQKNTSEKELKYLTKKRANYNEASSDLIFLLNRFLANYLSSTNSPFIELDFLKITNANYISVEDYLCLEIKELIHELQLVNSKSNIENIEITAASIFILSPEEWKKLIEIIAEKLFKNDLEKLNNFESLIKHSLEKNMSKIGVNRIWNMSFLKNHNEYIEAPLTKDNIILGEILGEKPKSVSIKTNTIPNKIKLYKLDDYLIALENLINEIKYIDNTRFYLNKSPQKLYKFISQIIKPSNKSQEIQIKRFINNCFNWDSKYNSIENYGDTITFLNKENIKSFVGGLWYLNENNIIETTSAEFFEKIIVDDLKDFNEKRLKLSYDNLRKYLSDYRDVFKKEHKELHSSFFK